MKGWFVGEGGLPMIRLDAVTVVEPGNDGDRSVVYVGGKDFRTEIGSVDVDRFLQELRDFHAGPAVEPEKPSSLVGRLYRLPTVEEVDRINMVAGIEDAKWMWFDPTFHANGTNLEGQRSVILGVARERWKTPKIMYRYGVGHSWEPLAPCWADGSSIEPI